MELIGLRVKHATFGVGTITEQDDNYITVAFATKVTKFVSPDAFEKYIRAEDDDIQTQILANITEMKLATMAKRQIKGDKWKAQEQNHTVKQTQHKKKEKTLGEMFVADYHVEKLARQPVLTYQQVEEQFGIRIAGFGRGINSTDKSVVLISSIGKSSGKFVYHDRWTEDGDYLYSGEGKSGDQVMTKGNLAIKDAARNGKKICL